MGIVVRQSIKSVTITLLGVLLGGLITALSARFFPKPEYGFTQSLIKITQQVSYLGLFGFNTTLLIYGQKFPPGHRLRGAFLTVCGVFPLSFSIIACVAYFIFKDWFLSLYSPEDAAMIHRYFTLFPLLTFFSVIISWAEGFLQSLHKTALQNLAREILARVIYITLILLFALNRLNFDQFIWLYVLLYLVPIGFLLWAAKRSGSLVFEWHKQAFSAVEIRELLRFSGYHMFTVISTVLILQLDAVLLGPLAKDGLAVVAVYSVATLVISILRNITRVVSLAAMPSLSQHYQGGKIRELHGLFVRSAVNMQILGIAMFLLVYLNINNIQHLMAFIHRGYGEIKGIILILMVGQLADMLTGLNYELISVTKYYRFNFWIALVLLGIVFLLNYFLIRIYGVYGAAWATTTGLIIFNIAKSVFLWKKLRMQPFGRGFFLVAGAGVLSGMLAWCVPYLGNVFADILVRSTLLAAIFGGLVLWWKASPELNELALNIWRHKKLF